jgi:hypothetical protein
LISKQELTRRKKLKKLSDRVGKAADKFLSLYNEAGFWILTPKDSGKVQDVWRELNEYYGE